MKKSVLSIGFVLAVACAAFAYDNEPPSEDWSADIVSYIDANTDTYDEIALDIGSYAELGFQEFQSSARLVEHLERHGFVVETGVAKMPTAFVATYGSGGPVIDLPGEFRGDSPCTQVCGEFFCIRTEDFIIAEADLMSRLSDDCLEEWVCCGDQTTAAEACAEQESATLVDDFAF